MSRIGNRELKIPTGVTVTLEDNNITVKGPKGELHYTFDKNMKVEIEGDILTVKRPDDQKRNKELHGTTNANIANMLIGVSDGFSKTLEIVGVGYRCQVAGNKVTLNVGYSHPVIMDVPSDLKVEAGSQTELTVSGIDKQKVSEFAANIRKVRAPEPYKGKGIRYKDEYIRRKEGKKASK